MDCSILSPQSGQYFSMISPKSSRLRAQRDGMHTRLTAYMTFWRVGDWNPICEVNGWHFSSIGFGCLGENAVVGGRILARQFIYLRHGETDWNVERRCLGQADRHLTERGRQQAERAQPQIAALGRATIFHSPLIRAAETARIIARDGQTQLVCEPDLKECCLGDKEGCFETGTTDNFVARWAKGGHIPNAESYAEFRERVTRGLNRCLSTADAVPPIIVAHSAVFWALLDAMSVPGHDIDHCTPVRFTPTTVGWIEERV